MSVSVTAHFSHPNSYVGNLAIENGLDQAQWSYNLNTQVYPTYGGEVIQILSVNIGDITLGGSITTYQQAQLIYSFFARYFQIATQGASASSSGDSAVAAGMAYNQQPMTFSYPMRDWNFQIQPKSAPGFRYDVELVNPVWVMTAHVVDTSNEGGTLAQIKQAIKDQVSAAANGVEASVAALFTNSNNSFNTLTDQISPNFNDPNTDPFQTYDEGAQQAEQALGGVADYYASLVSAFGNGAINSLTGGVGSQPAASSPAKGKAQAAKKAQTVSGGHRAVSTPK
jgi:hypothetical protein